MAVADLPEEKTGAVVSMVMARTGDRSEVRLTAGIRRSSLKGSAKETTPDCADNSSFRRCRKSHQVGACRRHEPSSLSAAKAR